MLAPSVPSYTLYRKTVSRMGWSMLLFIGLFNACSSISVLADVIGVLLEPSALSGVLTALSGILSAVLYMVPFFVTGIFYYFLSRRDPVRRACCEVKLPREFPLWILGGMAVLTAGAYVNSWFCSAIGYTFPGELLSSETYDDPAAVILYMTVALAPALAEEFLFRGVFYENLRPFGRTQAIILSSLLFALMHQNIAQLFYTFVGGILMALMYERTGSIWCSVFFHMFNNEMAVIYELLYYRAGGEAISPYLTLLEAVVFLLGAVSLVVLMVYERRSQSRAGMPGDADAPAVEAYDEPLSSSAALKGALCPGMVVFTAVTVGGMLITWLGLALVNGGMMG